MNLAGLKAAFEKNRKPLAIAGATAVGGLALLQARKGSGGGAAAAAPARQVAAPAGAAGSAQTQASYAGGWAPYDSSASDVYNALAEPLAQISARLDAQKQTSPIPLPAAGFYREPESGAIYRVDEQANRDWLSPTEWAAMQDLSGGGRTTAVTRDSTFWKSTIPLGIQPAGL